MCFHLQQLHLYNITTSWSKLFVNKNRLTLQKHQFIQDSFRRATLKDVPKIEEITDAAYNSVEIGQTGLAFRLENTFRSHHMFEPDHRSDIDHFFILKNKQNIVGAVGAKVDENLETVEIGPLAVDPNHQVRKKNIK